jgi:hypothetical protein
LYPSEMFAIMDARGGLLRIGGTTGWCGLDWTACVVCPATNIIEVGSNYHLLNPPQHGNYFNVLSCDAHVSAIPIADLFNPEVTARNWNVDHQPHPELWSP